MVKILSNIFCLLSVLCVFTMCDDPASNNESDYSIVGIWCANRIDGSLDPDGNPLVVTGDVSSWIFNRDGTYTWFLYAPPYYDVADTGKYEYKNQKITFDGQISQLLANGYIECPENSTSFTFLDYGGARWTYELSE